MKKLLIALLAIFAFSVYEHAEAAVIWDGAEIVEDQNGKMTFKKDVKVYKKLPNGQFESLVVKRNNFFRVYNVEKYNNQTYYWMSSGYRVQATDLVIYKEVPSDVKQQVMNAYYYTVTNPNGAQFKTKRSETSGDLVQKVEVGYSFFGPAIQNGYITQTFSEVVGYPSLDECDGCGPTTYLKTGFINAKNVKQAAVTASPYKAGTYLVLTKAADLYSSPITKKELNDYLFSNTYFDEQRLDILPKGTVVQASGKVVGGQLQLEPDYANSFIDLKNVAPLPKPTTQYMQYGLDMTSDFYAWTYMSAAGYNSAYIPRNEAVQVYASNGIKSFISYKGKYGFVPSNALSTKKANVPSITGTISPKKDLTFVYHNLYHYASNSSTPIENVLTSTDGKSWLLEDGNGFIYEETDKYFRFRHQIGSNDNFAYYPGENSWYSIQKPIKEGSKIEPYGKVLTIFSTYTTPAGTFKNVFVTDMGYFIAPGYGIIQFWDNAYATQIK